MVVYFVYGVINSVRTQKYKYPRHLRVGIFYRKSVTWGVRTFFCSEKGMPRESSNSIKKL